MVKQYVGARYVPKFASPVEWAADTSYEALTIVTFNNASYTSKVQVPPTVGNPANNPKYWALTGNYNAQVEQYRQETENYNAQAEQYRQETENYNAQVKQYRQETENYNAQVEQYHKETENYNAQVEQYRQEAETVGNNLNKEITDRENADTAITTTIKQSNTLKHRYFLFVGDSYAEGKYSWNPSVIGWPYLVSEKLGLTDGANAFYSCKGQRGFATEEKFITLLQAFTGDHNLITDIVIGGGWNDIPYEQDTLEPAMIQCINYAKTNFPNAKIWICYMGWGRDYYYYEWCARCKYIYKIVASNNGCAFIDKADLALHWYGSDGCFDTFTSVTDGAAFHPNAVGENEIANVVSQALNYGDYDLTRGYSPMKLTPSGINATGSSFSPLIGSIRTNDTASIVTQSEISLLTNITSASEQTGAANYEIGTLSGGYCSGISHSFIYGTNLNIRVTDDTKNYMTTGEIFAVDGKLYIKIKLLNSDGTGWANIKIDSIEIPQFTINMPLAFS